MTHDDAYPAGRHGSTRVGVLVVTPWFGHSTGGVETHVSEVTSRLNSRGVRIRVLSTDPIHTLPRSERVNGILVERARSWPRSSDIGFAPGLVRMIRQAAPELMHVQGVHTLVAPIAMLSALVGGVPFVVTFHSGGHSASWRRLIRTAQWRTLRPLLRRAAALIAVSEFERQLFADALRIDPERIQVIPNGVDVEPAGRRRGARTGPLHVLSVGRLERYKGHHRVLRAWPRIAEMWPGSRLTIVGDGPAASELRAQVAALGLQSVDFQSFGREQRRAYFDLLRSADVVLALSDYESQGIVVLEALACGADVVVQSATALQEYVARGWAAGVPVDASPEEVATAIREAVARDAPTPSIPTWDECADRLESLYASVPRAISREAGRSAR